MKPFGLEKIQSKFDATKPFVVNFKNLSPWVADVLR